MHIIRLPSQFNVEIRRNAIFLTHFNGLSLGFDTDDSSVSFYQNGWYFDTFLWSYQFFLSILLVKDITGLFDKTF
jgi:hypothetical protein